MQHYFPHTVCSAGGQQVTTFSYDGAVIQDDTIAVSGIYNIVASGGQGGNSSAHDGGLAASSGGDIYLQAGAVLEIVVGGAGGNNTSTNGAGGGGGSFVIEINNGSAAVNTIEEIAGGGGGAGFLGAGGTGITGEDGMKGGGASGGDGGALGAAGAGGSGSGGGGGGGFKGGTGGGVRTAGSGGTAPGTDFAGGSGAFGGLLGSDGGFGGGGGGGYNAGGGGGGFGGGGGGGGAVINNGGGGGGSYFNPHATDSTGSDGVHSGNGVVTVNLAAGPKTFSYDGVIQYDTITATGTYDIVAAGGQGGNETTFDKPGGLGGSSGGNVFLQAGAVLEIVVGGVGSDVGSLNGAGGGGGSFVIEINNGSGTVDINEVIAGGGGGAGLLGAGGIGVKAPTGGHGGGTSSGAGGVNGAAGSGGFAGGGGGGFQGGNGGSKSGTGGVGIAGGTDFAGGSGGADGGSSGGFGGGGGGGYSGGGGGGGWGGGGGGGRNGSSGGGGGGSYVNSTIGVTKSAGVNSGAGFVTITPVCYCLGTRIRTVRGEIAVEDLAIGDLVVTAAGRARPVQWIGRRWIDLTRHADPARARPIRIAAGAFPGGVPHRDLLVSPDHAVVFDGMLIPAKLLANGASIAADTACRDVTYFHVELASHDILLAEGLAAESYLDTGNRDMFEDAGFENAAPAIVLHPDFGTGQQARVSRSCLPFADRPDQIEPVWRALVDRARALGWAVPRPAVADDPDLHVRIGTRRIDPVAVGDGRYTFVLPAGGAQVTLASRAARPSEARPWIADDRLLGAMVRRLVFRNGNDMRDVAMDDPALRQGWWAVESDAGRPCRWTSGEAMLPFSGAGVLEVELSAAMLYPAEHTAAAVGAPPERAAA